MAFVPLFSITLYCTNTKKESFFTGIKILFFPISAVYREEPLPFPGPSVVERPSSHSLSQSSPTVMSSSTSAVEREETRCLKYSETSQR